MNDPTQRRPVDEELIREVARAYLESWLDGDGERMRSALSPSLAKRGLEYEPDGSVGPLRDLDMQYMVASAGQRPRPEYERTCQISILDLAANIASVKVRSQPFIDYLHVAKIDGRWSIVNVLYEERQPDLAGEALTAT